MLKQVRYNSTCKKLFTEYWLKQFYLKNPKLYQHTQKNEIVYSTKKLDEKLDEKLYEKLDEK